MYHTKCEAAADWALDFELGVGQEIEPLSLITGAGRAEAAES